MNNQRVLFADEEEKVPGLISKKRVYDIEAEEKISVFNGVPTALYNLNKIKYPWAHKLWKLMLSNTWFPEEVNMANDKRDYQLKLDRQERMAYNKALAQLIFMDSLQTNNLLDNINPFITAPEINLALIRQAFEEALHSQSYAVMIDSLALNPDEIYDLYRTDMELKSKNDFIADVYITLASEPTEINFIRALFANQILEGIYFYSGFSLFYSIAKQGKMLGSAQMIRFIQRDEITHLSLFQHIINAIKKEKPFLFTSSLIKTLINELRIAVEIESHWGAYITQGKVFGLSEGLIRSYIEYLANKRLIAIGIEPIYEIHNNPMKWVDDFSSFNDQRSNFFEAKVTNYSKGTLSFGDF